jgi:hypothetical protein
MELDKLKEIWQSGNTANEQNFNKEKVMRSIQNRIELLQLHDKKKSAALIMGIICLAVFSLGLVLGQIKGNGWAGREFFWIFGASAPFLFYNYFLFSKTPLTDQPTPSFVDHVLKRIKAHRIGRWGIMLSLVLIEIYIISNETPTDRWNTWDASQIIGASAFAILTIALLGGVFWYQRKYQTGDVRTLVKDLKRLKEEMGEN